MRHPVLFSLTLALFTSALAASTPVSYNGVRATLDTQQRGGVTYVDAAAFVKAFKLTLNVKTLPKLQTINGRAYVDVNVLASALNTKVAVSQGVLVYAQNQAPAVKGTTQLAGGAAVVGQAYTVGKQNPLNFTLRSAEFSLGRFNIDGSSVIPSKSQKLLVLRYTVHNPQNRDLFFRGDQIKITAVDANDVNHTPEGLAAREGQTAALEINLKPAQKIDVVTAILVPANGAVPKLIVEPQGEETPTVLRYDLRGVVKPLPAVFAANDKVSAPAVISASMNAALPLGRFDLTVKSVAYSKDNLAGGASLEEGQQFAVITAVLKNAGIRDQFYRGDVFPGELTLDDGERVKLDGLMMLAKRDEDAEGQLRPGEETTVRFLAVIPDDRKVKSVALSEEFGGEEPTHAFDIAVK